MFVKFLFSQKKHCFIIFPYNVEIDFLIHYGHYGLVTCLNYQKYCPIIRTPGPFFMLFSSIFPLRAAPSSMVLGRVFAKWRAVLFCTKSYYPLVDGTSPIPLNKLNAWLRNSYESLYFAVGYFFRNEKRGEPISLKLTDSPLELS